MEHQKPYTQLMPHLLKVGYLPNIPRTEKYGLAMCYLKVDVDVDVDVDECGIDCGFYKAISSNQFL